MNTHKVFGTEKNNKLYRLFAQNMTAIHLRDDDKKKLHLLAFSLVATYLELDCVIPLMQTSKSMGRTLMDLTEIHSLRSFLKHGAAFIEGLLNTFRSLKQCRIDAQSLDYECICMLLSQHNISILKAFNVSCRSSGSLLLPTCFHLKHLDLIGCTPMVEDIVTNCDGDSLQFLSIKDNIFLKSLALTHMLSSTKVLSTLQLSNVAGLESFTFLPSLRRCIKVLSITRCRFFNRIHLPSPEVREVNCSGIEQRITTSLVRLDLSGTSIMVRDLEHIVSISPYLEHLIVTEVLTLRTKMTITSSSLQTINLQFCHNLSFLSLTCYRLVDVDLRGCFSLRQLSIQSSRLQTLDLSMLSRLSNLDVIDGCPCLRVLDLAGCSSLSKTHWLHKSVPPEAMMSHTLSEPNSDDDEEEDVVLSNALGNLKVDFSHPVPPVSHLSSKTCIPPHQKEKSTQKKKSRRSSSL